MTTDISRHASTRAQQRGVPPLILNWLLDYGAQEFDGRGGVVRYFDNKSVRHLEREVGHAPVARLSEYLRCYLVESARDGGVITVGKRHSAKTIRRK
jgi:hypothetical protein